jgi:hypothetical protein
MSICLKRRPQDGRIGIRPETFALVAPPSTLGLSVRFDNPTRPNKQPGDFGAVDKRTGELVVEGNIYTHADIVGIASQYPPVLLPEVDHFSIHSYEVRGLSINAGAGL